MKPWERYQQQASGPWSAYQRPEQQEVGRLEALGLGAQQGATFGFSDEIGAATDAAARKWLPNFLGLLPSGRQMVTAEGDSVDLSRDERPFGEIYSERVS